MVTRILPLAVVLAAAGSWPFALGSADASGAKPWRGGWCGLRDIEAVVQCAKDVQFNALIAHGRVDRMAAFCELAHKHGIEPYYWFSPIARGDALAPLRQVMRPADETRMAEIKADKDPLRHGYQSGGEPLAGHHDVLLTRILCFHRPEVVEHCQRKIREMLEACPTLAGVAFDYFGYQNYRCCVCPHSMKLFAEFQRTHPDLPGDQALDRFSLETLVSFTNDLATFVRQIKPGAKVAIHVYPVFQPQPLYGNRLDVDYCCQTVAWFFKPYWSAEKVSRYARVVVDDAARYHPRQQGIPFVGVYVGRPYADKPRERLAQELRTIRAAARTTSLSVCSFNEFVKHPAVRQVVKQALGAQGE